MAISKPFPRNCIEDTLCETSWIGPRQVPPPQLPIAWNGSRLKQPVGSTHWRFHCVFPASLDNWLFWKGHFESTQSFSSEPRTPETPKHL